MKTSAPTPPNVSPADGNSGHGMSRWNAIYYKFKPHLPVSVRYLIRRMRARYKLLTEKDWPILESAGKKPTNWRGWPGGKQFAVVLTHDVEGKPGLDRSAELAALEARLGFRSSYNFIPEGDYRVSDELRNRLTSDGFEVGVHDLKHDGTLYSSQQAFTEGCQRINEYLKLWGAVGFRAGFMFHNLEWLKDLEIEYDASTFDTDPFEPQPQGIGTIFPFWVPGRKPGEGYVELPYTLPQDSTMFLILREPSFAIWQTKLDWIAANGGMALINVHPDYAALNGTSGVSEFDGQLYASLLKYIKNTYPGAYWQALPREVARHIRKNTVLAPA